MGFTFYSDGSYVPLDAYIQEEEPLDFETTSAESPEAEPADEADADEQTSDASETEPDDTDQSLAGTADENSTDIGNDVPPIGDRSLDEENATFEDDEDMDDGM